MIQTMTEHKSAKETFDQYAGTYEEALDEGIRASGEGRAYFAEGRVRWLAACLSRLGLNPQVGIDFGCGTGDTCPFLLRELKLTRVVGLDVSDASVEYARSRHTEEGITFEKFDEFTPSEPADVTYCNGVFHHIPPNERLDGAKKIWAMLKPGGMFSLWENNPWNPATRYVMSKIPFDRDANLQALPETRKLLEEAGFEIVRTDYLFIFPRFLAWLRPLEPALSRWPLGTQYHVLARRPMEHAQKVVPVREET